jgi:hypothetical protein
MAVFLGVMLAGFLRVMCCVVMMPVGNVGMMTGFLVITGLVVLGGGTMMAGRMFKVVCCFPMVFGGFF